MLNVMRKCKHSHDVDTAGVIIFLHLNEGCKPAYYHGVFIVSADHLNLFIFAAM